MSDTTRFEAAVTHDDPIARLRQLAVQFAQEGDAPEDVYQRFDTFRALLRVQSASKRKTW